MKIKKFLKSPQVYNLIIIFILILVNTGCGSSRKTTANADNPPLEKTLLWRITGNGITQPSYLFGTIHVLCKEDALLSDSLRMAIRRSQGIYFEVDMDNLVEMMGAMTGMKMKNDTTLADLLDKDKYQQVKTYFTKKGGLLPFSMLEQYKPFLAASMLMQDNLPCDQNIAMEQVIMNEAKKNKKKINGLETLAYQMSIFDSIPYKQQADLLVKYIDADTASVNTALEDYKTMVNAYKAQDLEKLEALINQEDMGIANFEDLLLNNRNRNWVLKLKTLLRDKTFVIAVGAGHLPGKNGLIQLLREAGYTIEPVDNQVEYKAVPDQEI